jgi:very-short-patch-repair endonuclease
MSVFSALCASHGLPAPVQEWKLHPVRKWRCDWAWPNEKVALEVDGGAWTGGRHTRGAGFLKDMEKANAAVLLGWRVVRCTPLKLHSMETINMLKALLL